MSLDSVRPEFPLRFDPIFQYRLWGGRRLESLLSEPLPGHEAIGEAWILSDRDDFASHVTDGPLKGLSLTQLMAQFPTDMIGDLSKKFKRFPLLLKFLDAREMLSVQVHPEDSQTDLLPPGERGKTEAWVVLASDPQSTIYAGLKPGTTPDQLRQAITDVKLEDFLTGFTPQVGDGVFIPAGTVHALGGGVMVFEVQENSDVTFRLYDWGRIDAKTGKSRELHVEKGLACIDFGQGAIRPVVPVVESQGATKRELLFQCDHFWLWRHRGASSFAVGAKAQPRVLVGLEGKGQVEHWGADYPFRQGDVMLLPAAVGECECRPESNVILLEIALPDTP